MSPSVWPPLQPAMIAVNTTAKPIVRARKCAVVRLIDVMVVLPARGCARFV
jgi:hypothetical protein